MTDTGRLAPLFVDEIPREIEAAKLYISIPYTTRSTFVRAAAARKWSRPCIPPVSR